MSEAVAPEKAHDIADLEGVELRDAQRTSARVAAAAEDLPALMARCTMVRKRRAFSDEFNEQAVRRVCERTAIEVA